MAQYVSRVTHAGDDGRYINTGWYQDVNYTMGRSHLAFDFGALFRWTNVTVPAGSTIDSAYIQFVANFDLSVDTVNLMVEGIDEDDTATFGDSSPLGRDKTTANVVWNAVPHWTTDQDDVDTRTPDIASVIQEIIDRGGWASGNALALHVKNNGSTTGVNAYRCAYDYDSGEGKSAQLTINYTLPIQDSGVRIYTSGGVKKVAAASSLGTESLRVYTGAGVKGIKLVATDAATAIDGLRIYTSSGVKCLEEYT